MTASANFLGDIPDLDHMADRLWLGDERATTRAADDDTCRLQFAKRPVRRHARDVALPDQLGFRRHAVSRFQPSFADNIMAALLNLFLCGLVLLWIPFGRPPGPDWF